MIDRDVGLRAHRCTAHHSTVPGGCEPSQQLGGVADRCRQTDALQRSFQILVQPMQHRAHVPPSVIRRERMQFIDDHGTQVAEPCWPIDPHRNQHGLDGFGCRQQDVGGISKRPVLAGLRDVAMPHLYTPTHQPGVVGEPVLQVVQQRLDRADVQHARPGPGLGQHPRQHRNRSGFRLPPGGRCEQQTV